MITRNTIPQAISSSQTGPHRRLEEIVRRHLESPWHSPLHAPSSNAFEKLAELIRPVEMHRLVLDAGCGTGRASRQMAASLPDAVVIGVDKSAARLAKTISGALPVREGNLILVRAELATFWRLALDAGWMLKRHFLLYPNPWPKPGQLKRRWHAHPAFPVLLALGGTIEMRCNWKIYAEEFALATKIVTGTECGVQAAPPTEPVSAFEQKYRGSGHDLYRVHVPASVSRDWRAQYLR